MIFSAICLYVIAVTFDIQMLTAPVRRRLDTLGPLTELHRTLHRTKTYTQDSETICRDWRRLSHPEVVGVPGCRNV